MSALVSDAQFRKNARSERVACPRHLGIISDRIEAIAAGTSLPSLLQFLHRLAARNTHLLFVPFALATAAIVLTLSPLAFEFAIALFPPLVLEFPFRECLTGGKRELLLHVRTVEMPEPRTESQRRILRQHTATFAILVDDKLLRTHGLGQALAFVLDDVGRRATVVIRKWVFQPISLEVFELLNCGVSLPAIEFHCAPQQVANQVVIHHPLVRAKSSETIGE